MVYQAYPTFSHTTLSLPWFGVSTSQQQRLAVKLIYARVWLILMDGGVKQMRIKLLKCEVYFIHHFLLALNMQILEHNR